MVKCFNFLYAWCVCLCVRICVCMCVYVRGGGDEWVGGDINGKNRINRRLHYLKTFEWLGLSFFDNSSSSTSEFKDERVRCTNKKINFHGLFEPKISYLYCTKLPSFQSMTFAIICFQTI